MKLLKNLFLSSLFLFFLTETIGQGTWDQSFADSGQLILGESDYRNVKAIKRIDETACYLLLQESEKVTIDGRDGDIVLSKFCENGNLAEDFGVQGSLVLDFPGYDFSSPSDMVVTEDGSIFIYGYAYNGNQQSVRSGLLLKLTGSGSVDKDFANAGVLKVKFLGNYDQPEAMFKDKQDRLLLTGASRDSTDGHGSVPVIARYFQDGTLDRSFGKTGKVEVNSIENVVPVGNTKVLHSIGGVFYDVLESADGKIYAAGSSTSLYNTAFIVRLNEDGSADSSFNETGRMVLEEHFNHESWIRSLTELSNGHITMAIETDDAENDFTVGWLKEGVFNKNMYDVNGKQGFLEQILEDQQGNLILLGRSIPNENMNSSAYSYQFSAMKINAEGDLQKSFSGDGIFELSLEDAGQQGGHTGVFTGTNDILLAGNVYAADLSSIHAGVIKITNGKKAGINDNPDSGATNPQVFPNPVRNLVFIKAIKEIPKSVSLYNSIGELIKIYHPKDKLTQIDLGDLSSGVYVITLQTEFLEKSYKIVKQ